MSNVHFLLKLDTAAQVVETVNHMPFSCHSVVAVGRSVSSSYQATIRGTGKISATILIESSNDGLGWVVDNTIEVSSKDGGLVSGGAETTHIWKLTRASIIAISGNVDLVYVSFLEAP